MAAAVVVLSPLAVIERRRHERTVFASCAWIGRHGSVEQVAAAQELARTFWRSISSQAVFDAPSMLSRTADDCRTRERRS